jgi:hypothetical protein
MGGGSRFPPPRKKQAADRGTLARHAGTPTPDLSHRTPSSLVALCGTATAGDALWLSSYGPPMTDNGIYCCIVARTREGLGQPINPHLFRDCAATSIAIDDPVHIGIACRLLGHSTASTTERYYNQAQNVEASRLMQNSLLARRDGVVGHRSHGYDPVTQHEPSN